MRQGFVAITFRKTCTESKKEIPLRSKQGLTRGRDRAGTFEESLRRRKGRHLPHNGGREGDIINKASSEAATGPGIYTSKYGKAKRSPLPPQRGTGGGFYIEIWCNGSTTDFGSVCPSSNLGISTTKARHPPGFFASDTKRLYKVKNSRNYAAIKGRNYQDINTIYKPRIIIITKAMQIT